MRTWKKFFIIFLIIALLSALFINLYVVDAVEGGDVAGLFNGMSKSDIDSKANSAGTTITSAFAIVLDVVRIACAGIALVLLTVVGAKYMLASPNERADIKQSLMVYLIGAFVMFGASAIVTIVAQFTEGNINYQ